MSQDFSNIESLGFQISADGQRVWVCVNGQCVLRAKGIEALEVRDDRLTHCDDCDKDVDGLTVTTCESCATAQDAEIERLRRLITDLQVPRHCELGCSVIPAFKQAARRQEVNRDN